MTAHISFFCCSLSGFPWLCGWLFHKASPELSQTCRLEATGDSRRIPYKHSKGPLFFFPKQTPLSLNHERNQTRRVQRAAGGGGGGRPACEVCRLKQGVISRGLVGIELPHQSLKGQLLTTPSVFSLFQPSRLCLV